MASIYKRGGVWWGRAQRDGKEYRRSLKTQSQGVARRRLGEWIAELDAIGWGDTPRRTLNDAAAAFIGEHLPHIRPSSARRYGISLEWLDQRMGTKYLDEIGSAELVDFETWRRGAGAAAPTIRRDLACLSSLFSFAIEREWIEANPVGAFLRRAKKRGLRESEGRTRYLTNDEETRLLAQATDEVRRAVVLSIATGLRQQELFRLRWADVDLAARTITIDGATAKGRRTRVVAILPAGLAILAALPRHIKSPYVLWHDGGKPYRHLNRGLAGAASRAKVPDLIWHDLRRTHGCRLIQDLGWSMEMVRDQLGHSTVATTEKSYAFLRASDRVDRAGSCAEPPKRARGGRLIRNRRKPGER